MFHFIKQLIYKTMDSTQKADLERDNVTATNHIKRALDKFSRVGMTVSAAENQAITNELMEALLTLTSMGANLKYMRVAPQTSAPHTV